MLLQYLLEDLEEYDIKKGNTNIDIEKSNMIQTRYQQMICLLQLKDFKMMVIHL